MSTVRTNTILNVVIVLSIVYVGVPLFFHFFAYQDSTRTPSPTASSIIDADMASEASPVAINPSPALFSFTELGIVVRAVGTFFLSVFSYTAWILHKVAYLPIWHTLRLFGHSLKLAVLPLQPLLAPFTVTLRIAISLALAPGLLIYKMWDVVYPLYVLLGSACVCGALLGFGVREVSKVVVMQIRSRYSSAVVSKEDRPLSGKRRRSTLSERFS